MDKYYSLNKDIYLVMGTARACLYDLMRGNLYSISDSIKKIIEKITKTSDTHRFNVSEKEVIDYLIRNKIIIKTNIAQPLKDIRELRKDYPLDFAWIEVTRQCNLSCTFCYEGSNPYCTERMSFDDFTAVVDNLKEAGIKKIQFIGGEPLVIGDTLKQMICYAKEHFDFIEVYTNGIMINEKWSRFFKENNIHIALSIHSYIAEEHDRVTQVKGSHRKVERALEHIKRHQIPYRIGTVVSKSCKLGKPSKNTNYRLQPSYPKIASHAEYLDLDYETFKGKAITKKTKAYPINKEFVIRSISGHQCFMHEVYISSTMDVFPCVMERRMSHGNLTKQRLKSIINNKIRQLSKDYVEGCKNCEYRYACFDCRPDSRGNGFYSKPWFCSYDPTTGKWADLKEMYKNLRGSKKLNSIPIKVQM